MSRYKRAEVIAWLEAEGCEFDAAFQTGLIFYDRTGTKFTLPDPLDDGWLDVDLVEDVLANRWVGVGTSRPEVYG